MRAGRNPGRRRLGCSWFPSAPGTFKCIAATGWFLLAAVADNHAQQPILGHATDFTSDEYFEPPNQQHVKMRLTGTSASPLPGGMLDITNLTIVTFDLSGKTQMVVRAPECVYAPYDYYANSAGHVEMETSDGKITITGDGFLWRQSDNSLTISNNVHTVIKMKGSQSILP